VTGANASGKSSFLMLLYGDLSPAFGGGIERSGFPAGTPIEAWKRTVGYVSPELQADYASDVSLVDLVASGRHSSFGLADRPTSSDRRIAARWLEFFELSAVATRRPREISYGQMRRALLARALAANPRILLLDEPLTGLDPGQRAATKRLLERLMARRVSVVIAVHHAEDLPRGIARTLHLYKREVFSTDPEPRKPSCP
jgi:molybdate transport system ATP-binding protein